MALKEKYAVDMIYRGDAGATLLAAGRYGHDCLALIARAETLKDDRNDIQAVRQEVRAWGFSSTSRSLVLASSGELTVYCRVTGA